MLTLSVITVVFNGVDVIEDTIKSVINQSDVEIDYIVLDGGSTDGTVDIIHKYDKKISYWVSEPDLGIYDAMNKSLDHVTGDVVYFLNAGDYFYDKDALSRISKRFEEEPDIDILIGKEIIEGKVCRTYLDGDSNSVYFGSFFPHQATFSKIKLYKEYGLFNEEYRICADYDWVLGAYYYGYKFRWCDDVVCVYDPGGISSTYRSIAEQYLISTKYLALSGNSALLDEARKYYIKVFEHAFFRRLLENEDNSILTNACLKELTAGRQIDIWGAGLIGKKIHDLICVNGLHVEHILDSDSTKYSSQYDGTPICSFDGNNGGLIIIATADYEREVCQILQNAGLREQIDFLTYTEICSFFTHFLLRNGYDDGGFFAMTGLKYE